MKTGAVKSDVGPNDLIGHRCTPRGGGHTPGRKNKCKSTNVRMPRQLRLMRKSLLDEMQEVAVPTINRNRTNRNKLRGVAVCLDEPK